MTEQGNFEINRYEVLRVSEKAWCAKVTFTVDGLQYIETVCTVPGKEIADENYWRENCSRIKKDAVRKWLARHVSNDKATGVLKLTGIPGDRTLAKATYEAMQKFARSPA